jgi:hypothetical protein
LAATEPSVESIEVKPVRNGISVRLVTLAWIPRKT